MHVTRDRLSRLIDISSLLPSAKRRVNLVVDEPGLHLMGLSSKKVSAGQSGGATQKLSRRRVGLQRTRHRRCVNRPYVGQENQRPWTVRHGQRRGSSLPSWYPRTPLRDITAIVRAIERKRAKLRDDQTTEASQTDTDVLTPNTKLDNEINISTSISQPCEVKDGNVDKKGKDAENCTPSKTLLNSIEEVRQLWLEDQRKLEKTPAAKEVERQRKTRILRSMR